MKMCPDIAINCQLVITTLKLKQIMLAKLFLTVFFIQVYI